MWSPRSPGHRDPFPQRTEQPRPKTLLSTEGAKGVVSRDDKQGSGARSWNLIQIMDPAARAPES
jgi:hypothetical protein